MAIEIERKFLVNDDAWREAAHARIAMGQGYLNDAASVAQGVQNVSVRVRMEGDVARLNIKSREFGVSRQEFEYPIPVADANALLALSVGTRIEKTRHLLQHGAHLWEVDEFHGDNAGLIVAEVELDAEDAAIDLPPWVGAEVTHLLRYYNLNLAARPYSQWTDAERASIDA